VSGEQDSRQGWWGTYDVPAGGGLAWSIASRRTWVRRAPCEWQIATIVTPQAGPETAAADAAPRRLEAAEPPDPGAELRRFGFRTSSATLRIRPALADRPLVVDARTPFALTPGEELTLYVGQPVWAQFLVGQPEVRLLEFPLVRPNDTWFGANTRAGDLCYSEKTGARMDLANLAIRPHRAISVLHIQNRAATLLELEQLELPAPNMSLFADARGRLWTEAVTIERREDNEDATIRLDRGAPPEAASPRLVGGPRAALVRGGLGRVFGGVFGGGW
jgi:hypothetical protein